jgi:hypothetical protein
MNTIADFVSKDDEIERLNNQINMMAKFYNDFYKKQVKQLRVKIQSMQSGVKVSKSSRKNNVISMVKKLKGTGRPKDLIPLIAKECCLTEKRINQIWYSVK